MTSRADASIIEAFKDIYEYFKTKNLQPKLHILKNECSKAAKIYIKCNGTNIQI